MPGIAEYLLGPARTRVLATLFLHPERALHVRELARLAGVSPGSLHRELRGLSDAGLLVRNEVGRQVHYRANDGSPVFDEIAGLLRKTAGIADVLRDAISALGDAVTLAFIYGSIASGTETSRSDIDVMVLGTAGFGDVALALAQAQSVLGREINPTPMAVAEFEEKLKKGDGFATAIAAGAKIWLKGDEHDLAELAAHRKTQGARRHRA